MNKKKENKHFIDRVSFVRENFSYCNSVLDAEYHSLTNRSVN
jgi:hypothetical protein